MSKVSDVLNTKIGTYKEHLIPAAATAAVAVMLAVPLTLALGSNNDHVSANTPAASTTVASADGCSEPVAVTASAAKKAAPAAQPAAAHTSQSHNSGNGSGNNGNGNGNSGHGNGNTTTGGSSAANGNTQTNTGGLIGGVNAIVPVSALNNNNLLSGNQVNLLNGNANNNTVKVPVVTGILSSIGVNL